MQPLSNDLRKRILDAVDNREGSRRKLAVRFKVDTSTITKLLRLRRETGSIEPRPHAGGVTPTLDDDALQRLRKLVEETPDAALESLRRRMGISGSRMIICRARQKLGLPLKKKSPHASERDTPEVQEERCEFAEDVEPLEPQRLAFVDETGATTAMTPSYGRAPVGERVESSAPASWESVTVIAALAPDGVRAPLAIQGAVNAPTFLAYVERVLAPALHRGDVVIFDNLSSHLSPEAAAAIERAGASVLPPPPYSPDFSPIEEMFSKLEEFLRRVGARAKEHLYDAIGEGLREVTPRDVLGWFRHAGMCVMQA
jgi:transposase